MNFDQIIQGRCPCRFLPYVASEHFLRHDLATVAEQVFEEIVLPGREFDRLSLSRHHPGHEVHFEIADFDVQYLIRSPAALQGTDTGKELRKRERSDQV